MTTKTTGFEKLTRDTLEAVRDTLRDCAGPRYTRIFKRAMTAAKALDDLTAEMRVDGARLLTRKAGDPRH